MRVEVGIERLPHARDLPLPSRATEFAAGYDLAAAIEAPLSLVPGVVQAVPTGLVLALPTGFEGQVRPRSGLALRHAVTVANAPGTIDADYRGELRVLLINLGAEPFTVTRGMRIAQLVVAPVVTVLWAERSVAGEATGRGEGGFGSTGFAEIGGKGEETGR